MTVRHGEPVEKLVVKGAVEVPELGDISCDGVIHPLVRDLYQSMIDSGQRQYYEPTDWQFARIALYALNEELVTARQLGKTVGAMKLTALNQMLTALLLTEGDRRRVRIEIERAPDGPEGVVIDAAAQFKQWLEAP